MTPEATQPFAPHAKLSILKKKTIICTGPNSNGNGWINNEERSWPPVAF